MLNSSPTEPPTDGAPDDAEAKAAFYLRMRARGIRDRRVLRAFELVPRAAFVPARHGALAGRDLALPIDCGQTLHEPWLIATMIEALAVEPDHRVLQIGAGTGYATAILAQLADSVIGLERHQSLAVAAQTRLDALGIANAVVAWGDGLNLPPSAERFDRLIVHGALASFAGLADRLAENGVLVCAGPVGATQAILRVTEGRATSLAACRLQPLVPGLAGRS